MASGLGFLAVAALATIFPSWLLCRGDKRLAHAPAEQAAADSGLKQQIALAFRNPSYLLLHAGFLTCGFHVAFLTTHLPSEAALCGHDASVPAISLSLIGLCNIAGSIAAGFLGKHYPMKYILAVLYASRAVMIALFLLSSKSETAFYVFACAIGFTWLATVPPTAGIIGKLFGTRYLATLFGFTLFTHQIGAFFGAWLGGVAMQYEGSLTWGVVRRYCACLVGRVGEFTHQRKKPWPCVCAKWRKKSGLCPLFLIFDYAKPANNASVRYPLAPRRASPHRFPDV
ncbi:Arabinose efflux permease [Kluyvera cryocrescens]|uniref:Arabinose efflux permease n=1 Tax=Kluyvera cryocrescens TaxID=580 RepID=A0A485C9F0_KLUCR|nr:Arabinose efflux permease [Kluyvera cryocrescens]